MPSDLQSERILESYEVTLRVEVREAGTNKWATHEKLTKQKAQDLVNIIASSASCAQKTIAFKEDGYEKKAGMSLTIEISGSRSALKYMRAHERFLKGCSDAIPRTGGAHLVIGIMPKC